MRNVEVSRAHRAEYTWAIKIKDRGMCVYVLRNEYLCRLYWRKTGFVNFRVLNFMCHTNEDCFWYPMTNQHVYKELLNLKKTVMIQGALKSYTGLFMMIYKCITIWYILLKTFLFIWI